MDSNVEKNEKNQENENKSKRKRRNNLIVLTTKPISDKELKDLLNKEFGKNNQYYKILKEAVDNLTETYKKRLKNIMLLIQEGIKPEFITKDGKITEIEFKRKLTNDELENYVIMLPVEMFFVQEYMDNKALDMELSAQLKEFSITEKLLEIVGGTEKERLRAAEYNSMISIFTSIIKNRVYYNLKNELDQASKVYDALKRVIQLRITEMQTFGKSVDYISAPEDKKTVNNTEEIKLPYELANYVIRTNKYKNGITIKDLFFNDRKYFDWIKDNNKVSGVFVEYQKKIKEFKKEFDKLNTNYKVS